MCKGKIIIISGPSGSGKTTLYKRLLKSRKDLVKSISITTRTKRLGEKNGRDYVFVTHKQFAAMKSKNFFLEHEKVFDNFYGTPKNKVQELVDKGKNVLLCIDVKGAKTVCAKFPDAVKIFIKTPTYGVLKNRLMGRGSEDKKVIRLRLKTARFELKQAKNYDHVVVNNDLDKAYRKLSKIISGVLKKGHEILHKS